jgi:hypothetical protein
MTVADRTGVDLVGYQPEWHLGAKPSSNLCAAGSFLSEAMRTDTAGATNDGGIRLEQRSKWWFTNYSLKRGADHPA